MAKTLPYFRWFPADAESDGKYASMTLAELGLFHRCLNHGWINDGIPSDLSQLARELRVSEKQIRKLFPQIASTFFQKTEGRLHNKRQCAELEHARSKSVKASESVKVRYERTTLEPTNVLRDPEVVVVPRARARAESESESESGSGGVQGGALTPAELEAAWERHRKHSGRETQQLVFQRVIGMGAKFDLAKFRGRHPRYCEYWADQGWQYCPLTFLGWIENAMPEPPPVAKPSARFTEIAPVKAQVLTDEEAARILAECDRRLTEVQ